MTMPRNNERLRIYNSTDGLNTPAWYLNSAYQLQIHLHINAILIKLDLASHYVK